MFPGTTAGIGTVVEVHVDGSIWMACPPDRVPAPGQYLQAWMPGDAQAPLPAILFPGGMNWRSDRDSFDRPMEETLVRFVPPHPREWGIGTLVNLRGPLGQGFHLPHGVRQLALVGLGSSIKRLLPLIEPVLAQEGAVAVFTDAPLPQLPLAVEAYPLQAIADLLDWPGYAALDIPWERLEALRSTLGLEAHGGLPYPAEALITLPMPCAAMAECGACTVAGRHSNFLACEDGPVFDLSRLVW
jgi:NAD(P)H-flavin reductase